MHLTRTHRVLITVVVAGALIIAAIGFAGSYAAVRELAERKGFGEFAMVFPIGIDAGIAVLLALDLLLTWIRIPFPLLRQTAWLLTAATIAFNGAAAWPDPLGTAMHGTIPVLFIITVEAARHAIGRIADITADKHMEGVRLTRWLLSPVPTFLLWRRMKLWELRSYDAVIKLEQERLVYQARLRSRYGRAWRRKAPVESLMPLRLARYGVPLAETAPAGLAAAGIASPQLPAPAPEMELMQAVPSVEQVGESLQEWPANHDSPWFVTPLPRQPLQDGHPYDTYEQRGSAAEQATSAMSLGDELEPEPDPDGPHGGGHPTPAAPVATLQASQPGLPDQPSAGERTTEPESEPVAIPVQQVVDEDQEQLVLEDPAFPEGHDARECEHVAVLEGLNNAQAIRYAIAELDTFHVPRLGEWLTAHGRTVNRGQIYTVSTKASEAQAEPRRDPPPPPPKPRGPPPGAPPPPGPGPPGG
ncbi:DUF2637 domain-containing protein [Streptomyces sp. N35]|uniref:DUF2637 domain-containing protein n=1 Tax=Streptomyces sp. N35 TaxID=2795730 RepID=UPI0027DD2920|nr:DUF2637 domain-containing protein [Streptomyces sp. N35]